MLPDKFDQFGYLIDLGQALSPINDSRKTEDHLIKGCQAKVWMHSAFKDGKVYFEADADADYAKGMVAMMIRVLSGHTPEEIIHAPLQFIDKIGFTQMLSMKRAGGLASIVKQMKLDALAYTLKQQEL